MRRRAALLGLLTSFAGLGACSSLLGDFSAAPGGSPDGGTGSDDGSDGDATVDTNIPADDAPPESADAPGDSPSDASDATTPTGDSQAPSSDAGDSGSDASDAGQDAGQDATGGPGDASGDGTTPSSDAGDSGADAAAPPLMCKAWQYGTPIQVVSLQGQPAGSRTLAAPPAVFEAPSSDTMFVVLAPAPSNFQVYQVSLSRAMSQALTQTTTHGWVGSWLFTHDGLAVVSADPAANQQTSLTITDIPTSLGGGSTLPAGVPVWTFSGSVGYFSASAQELAAGTYDYLYTNSPSNGVYELFAGNNTSGTVPPVTIAMGGTRVDNNPEIVHIGSTSYVIEGGSPGQSPASVWVLPDNATSATGPRVISGNYTPFGLAMGANSSSSRINLAFADLQVTATEAGLQFGAADLRVGSLDLSQASNFALTDLPLNLSFPSLLNVPAGSGRNYWQGDNFILVGTPFGGAAAGGGIGLMWIDANGTIRATSLSPNNVLTSDSYVSQVGASLLTGFQVSGLAQFNVVWSDRLSDSNGAYDVVYANELDCH